MKKVKITSNTKTKDFNKLRRWNMTMAILHALQGIAVLVLARDVTFPINTSYLTLDTINSSVGNAPSLVPAIHNVANINLAYLVAIFFFMSAVAHGLLATYLRGWYEENLKDHINKARWIEYSLSASTMMVAIALLSGVYDLSSLVMIFGLTATMNLCGLVMELHNKKSNDVSWVSFVVGCIAGILPWVVIGIYFWGNNVYGSGQVPSFVYWIYVSLFVFFNCFAINMYLQYKKIGKWADYLYGERVYMILSLVAKSLLAWQVFFGALRP
jgi:hypothetical protein